MISGADSKSVGLDLRSLRRKRESGTEEAAALTSAALHSIGPSKATTAENLGVVGDKKPSGFLRPAGVDSPVVSGKVYQGAKRSEKRTREEDKVNSSESLAIAADSMENEQRKK